MNKTISANIGGRIFNIEEDAYEKLNAYLSSIRRYFGNQETADEIISDIELRIAELFLERISDAKQVITLKDVNEIISIMGEPEQFAESGEEEESTSKTYTKGSGKRRIFRDPDDKVVFGVCSGISAYMGWDPIVLRIAFAVALIFFGSGLLLYILLAIIIPTAKTTAEKLQMRGEPVTVENISKKVSESFEDMKEDLKNFGKKNDLNEERFRSEGERIGHFFTKVGHFIVSLLTLFVSFIARLLGVAFIVISILAILALLSAFLGWEFAFRISDGELFWDDHIKLIIASAFESELQRQLFLWGLAGILIIPFIGLFLIAIRLLFNFNKVPRYTGAALTGLWIACVVLTAYPSIKLLQNFQVEATYSEVEALPEIGSDLVIIDTQKSEEPSYRFRTGLGKGQTFFHGIVTFPGLDSTDIWYTGKNQLTVAMNESDSIFRLEAERSARGASQKDAINNASQITTHYTFSGDSLRMYPWFALKKGQAIRDQKVHYTLYVPVGKKVYFTKDAANLIFDVPNVTNTYDADMVGHTWIMTRNGLTCETCPEPENPGKRIPIEFENTESSY